MPSSKKTFKLVGTIAIVGSLAAFVALIGSFDSQQSTFSRLLASSNANANANSNDDLQNQYEFANFVAKYNRNYKNQSEFARRYASFKNNSNIIKNHNSQETGFELGFNQFSDLSNEEFSALQTLRAPQGGKGKQTTTNTTTTTTDTTITVTATTTSLPASVDWRTVGAVGSIRNQGSCGSCYTFSATSALESAYFIKYGSLKDFSEQQLVDCTTTLGNLGCGGGWMNTCFNYLKTSKLMNETSYPYVAKAQNCSYNATKGIINTSGYVSVTANNPYSHLVAIAKQPISIALRASSSAFQLYKSGILNSTTCGTTIDHAVTLIGYGTSNGTDYWLGRNSWGTYWGESGYFRIIRTNTTGVGMCGMLQYSSYPVLA